MHLWVEVQGHPLVVVASTLGPQVLLSSTLPTPTEHAPLHVVDPTHAASPSSSWSDPDPAVGQLVKSKPPVLLLHVLPQEFDAT